MTSHHRIHALPLQLANQIAAGEVIERPASVVKELVENSLDAGATQIDIDIEGAGQKLIRVRDNGAGIHPDDLALALSRHATSKLQSSDQLSYIASLGFRGEALPSISSISELTLTSRQKNTENGWQLKHENTSPIPASHLCGTSIEVRNLFFNVPARRHFLRSNKTEQHHILTTLQRLALSQFDVGFHCKISDSQQLKLPIASTLAQQQQRIAKICGKRFMENSIHLQQQYDEIKLSGWLAKAEDHRPQTELQYFFINGRVIRDRVISHAIRQSYGESIPAGRQPAYVLYLTLPLDRVDINVHPTKHEVRFRDARLIHGLITSALQEALATTEPTAYDDATKSVTHTPVAENNTQYQTLEKQTEILAPTTLGKAVSLIHQRYVISQSEDQGLLLIDLQSAERQLRQNALSDAISSGTLRTRPILVPIKLALETEKYTLAQQYESSFEHIGITLHFMSTGQANSIIIKSIPSLLAHTDIPQLLNALIDSLATNTPATSAFNTLLTQHIHTLPIEQLEQAQQVMEQCVTLPHNLDWCKQLDQLTLDSLFSNNS